MSNPAVCPECKKKPVAAGRYLCESCEGSIVAATEAEAERMNKSFRRTPRRRTLAIKLPRWRRAKDLDTQITEAVERAMQRPRWVQYAVMVWLMIIGTACVWVAKTVADDTHGRVAAVREVKETVTGIAQSWSRLHDALN